MLHIAIVGSGPAGYYTAEAAQKQWGEDVAVDVFDALPVPYGLIRTGVAPDHQSIKGVSRRYEKTALSDNVRFVGNVHVGRDVPVKTLRRLYDAVIFATGAPADRQLGIPGEELGNIFGSAAFVGWYNGHPQFEALAPDLSGKHAVIIGMGNVALDVARILSKTEREFAGSDIVAHALKTLCDSRLEMITILGRRGPHQIQMTPKELGELGELERAAPRVSPVDLPPAVEDDALDPGLRKSVALLRQFAATPDDERAKKPVSVSFDLFASPLRFEGEAGKVSSVVIEETELRGGAAAPTGRTYTLPANLVVTCIGYRTNPIEDVPFDEKLGRIANEDGRVAPVEDNRGLYCVGWARRGPTGTIGTNRPDGYSLVERIAKDLDAGLLGNAGKPGRTGFDHYAAQQGLDIVTFRDWQKIEEAENAAAREGSPREKFVRIEDMVRARSGM